MGVGGTREGGKQEEKREGELRLVYKISRKKRSSALLKLILFKYPPKWLSPNKLQH